MRKLIIDKAKVLQLMESQGMKLKSNKQQLFEDRTPPVRKDTLDADSDQIKRIMQYQNDNDADSEDVEEIAEKMKARLEANEPDQQKRKNKQSLIDNVVIQISEPSDENIYTESEQKIKAILRSNRGNLNMYCKNLRKELSERI